MFGHCNAGILYSVGFQIILGDVQGIQYFLRDGQMVMRRIMMATITTAIKTTTAATSTKKKTLLKQLFAQFERFSGSP